MAPSLEVLQVLYQLYLTKTPTQLSVKCYSLCYKQAYWDTTGMNQERWHDIPLHPPATHSPAGDVSKHMPELPEEATDATQEKKAETCVPLGLAACLLQE